MIYKAESDIKKGADIYICDGCDKHTSEPHSFNNSDNLYCKKCWDFQCGMGDIAAEAAMEREMERKHEV